jgi:hypothetical protein
MAAFLGAGTMLGLIFSITWVTAYPLSYFSGRALVARLRRGSWTVRAINELRLARPWGLLTAIGAVALITLRPWIILPGLLVVALWAVSVYLSWAGRERGITNDLLLILLASIAPILMYQVAKDQSSIRNLPHAIWIASYICLLFFVGSVLHVKALIREAKNPRWHTASICFHVVVLIILPATTHSWWLAASFLFPLVRTLVMKPGGRPGKIGIVEVVVAFLIITVTVLVEMQ